MLPAHIDRNMIPHKPGVYLFKNKLGKVIYVGKAIDLYHRVASYFNKSNGNIKTATLIDELQSVDTIIVESELEALILEANLIKEYLPQYNVRLTDDKDYLYIKITNEDFPKVITARKHELKNSLKYFGPFPSSRTVRETLKALRRVFPWCSVPTRKLASFLDNEATLETTISRGSELIAKTRSRSCFYYHLGLCSGPCAGTVDKKEYRKNIFRLSQLLEGKKEKLVGDIIKEMGDLAKQERFEEAARVKRTLNGLAYLTQPNRAQVYLENPNFMEDQRVAALEDLKIVLHLKDIPYRIECYDISNIQGKEATGSLVVLTEGEIDKSQYRKFKIRIAGRPNDVAMMREMIRRRLSHPEWPRPDLMLIDGGRGQVNGVASQISESVGRIESVILGRSGATTPESVKNDSGQARMTNSLGASEYQKIPLYGLAKRMEWLYSPNGSVVKLPRSSPALKLLQKIRDEAHRFAVTYHRKLHQKATFQGLL